MRILIGLLALAALAGCDANASEDSASAEAVEATLVEGFTIPENTTIASKERVDMASGEGWLYYLDSKAAVKVIEDYYAAEAEKLGFKPEWFDNAGGQRQMRAVREDGMMFDLSVASYGEGDTRVSIAIGRER